MGVKVAALRQYLEVTQRFPKAGSHRGRVFLSSTLDGSRTTEFIDPHTGAVLFFSLDGERGQVG